MEPMYQRLKGDHIKRRGDTSRENTMDIPEPLMHSLTLYDYIGCIWDKDRGEQGHDQSMELMLHDENID
jgi:hypothetical protein